MSAERPNRAPCAIWATRRDMSGCYVRTAPGDMVEIMMPMGGGLAEGLLVSRSEARLLAKRINECLDTTVIR